MRPQGSGDQEATPGEGKSGPTTVFGAGKSPSVQLTGSKHAPTARVQIPATQVPEVPSEMAEDPSMNEQRRLRGRRPGGEHGSVPGEANR